jgi:prepilin-type processing-associated H-X9-DG protein
MNTAVGTDPYTPGCQLPVNGGWLDGAHSNTRNGPWTTYGKTSSILTPTPASLFVLLDENPRSLNDACLAVTMVGSLFEDCPGIFHNLGCNLAFADGHCELKRWVDPRIASWPNGEPYNPINPDVTWLQARTSVHK